MDKFVANPPPLPKPLVKPIKKKKIAFNDQPACNMDTFVKQRPPPPPPPVLMLPPPAILSQEAVRDFALVTDLKMQKQLYKRFTKDDGNVYILAFDKFFMVWAHDIKTLDRGMTVAEKETVWADDVKYPLIRYEDAFNNRVPSTSL